MQNSGFTVDPAALHDVAKQLSTLAGNLETARAVTLEVDSSGFGSSRLQEAADGFVKHWEWQVKQLGSTLVDTADRLTQAANQYQKVEDAQLRAQGQRAAP